MTCACIAERQRQLVDRLLPQPRLTPRSQSVAYWVAASGRKDKPTFAASRDCDRNASLVNDN